MSDRDDLEEDILDRRKYDTLKKMMGDLKTKSRRSALDRETAANALLRQEAAVMANYEEEAMVAQRKIVDMKKTLTETNDRMNRMRAAHDRERSGWQGKLEQVVNESELVTTRVQEHVKTLEEHLREEHNTELTALRSQLEAEHLETVSCLEDDLRQCLEEYEERERAMEEAHRREVRELEAACEAKTAAAQEKCAAAHQSEELWRRRCEEATALCERLQRELEDTRRDNHAREVRWQQQFSEQRTRAEEAAGQLEAQLEANQFLKQKAKAAEARLREEKESHEKALKELQTKQEEELELVDERVRVAMDRKDNAIQSLRTQLTTYGTKLSLTTKTLERAQADLIAEDLMP